MLRELNIINLALIKELSVSFSSGLTVLTGETGAGKSIILQAIHLLGGGKAAATWVRSGADQAVVEALFEISAARTPLLSELADMGFETDGELIIKRVIRQTGRSSFYINGGLATAQLAGQIVENLLNVASQHDHQQLLESRYHLDFIDSVGSLLAEREKMASLQGAWSAAKSRYRQLRDQEKDKEQRKDFLAFQVQEIDEAMITVGEDAELSRQRDRLKASEDLMRLGQKSYGLLGESVSNQLPVVRRNLEQMASLDSSMNTLSEEVAGLSYQLEDSLGELRRYIESLPSDTSQLELVTERINLLQQLKRKYGGTLEDILAHADQARLELAELEEMDTRLDQLKEELAASERKMIDQARRLSEARRGVADQLARKVQGELQSLRFEQAKFEIRFAEQKQENPDRITKSGWDTVEFVFSANPGEAVRPVAKVASGGELSRLMLALKCILARHDQVETVIFDEVDAGISGKTAESVARKIKELASHHQVLCITHLPQIASYADDHLTVKKAVSGNRTQTTIARLAPEYRADELARMLDGDSVTAKTKAYARELIDRNR